MENIITLLLQIVMMFILSLVGYVMFKTKKISMEGSKNLGNILIFLSLPCVIINGFMVERSPERLLGLLISAVAALVVLALAMIISRLVMGRDAIGNFAGSFSNPGFFGIPLITAMLADGAVFYIAAFIAFLNLLQWTYGVSLLQKSDAKGLLPAKGKEKNTNKADLGKQVQEMALKLIKAPFMVAILIGLFFFLTQIPLPSVIKKCVSSIAGLNTPLAMFTIGIYLAQTDVVKMFTKKSLYMISLVRMILIPIASLAVLSLIPSTMLDVKMALLIAAACPVGGNVAVYAQLHNKDYSYAVETVIISTLLSVITLPAIVGLAGLLWH